MGQREEQSSGFETIKLHPCSWIRSFSRFSLDPLELKTAPASLRVNVNERRDLSKAERVLILSSWDVSSGYRRKIGVLERICSCPGGPGCSMISKGEEEEEGT